ncbi:hypothetical protein [Sulfobacillus thermosulfidooxidans]|uniref:hypothetical protein n=1 Tax=Sulfobacillus thermosulfidooxidans TaxID=28034 RepID=UPI000AAB8182|nr:hypothetical protein [Sulfobacillus thermosulfidooxidans]
MSEYYSCCEYLKTEDFIQVPITNDGEEHNNRRNVPVSNNAPLPSCDTQDGKTFSGFLLTWVI